MQQQQLLFNEFKSATSSIILRQIALSDMNAGGMTVKAYTDCVATKDKEMDALNKELKKNAHLLMEKYKSEHIPVPFGLKRDVQKIISTTMKYYLDIY